MSSRNEKTKAKVKGVGLGRGEASKINGIPLDPAFSQAEDNGFHG